MVMSQTIGKLSDALCKAQNKMGPAIKDAVNPHFKSSYANLTSIWEACRGPLAENGLSVTQLVESVDGASATVVTMLMHTSGEFVSGSLTLKPTKADAQGVGSAITYARRYGLAAIVGIVTDDDDGNAASTPPTRPVEQRNYTPNGPPKGNANGSPRPDFHKGRFSEAVARWSKMKGVDLDSARNDAAKRFGYKGASGLTEQQYSKMADDIDNLIDNGEDFLTWIAQPVAA